MQLDNVITLFQWFRFAEVVALGKVDTDLSQLVGDGFVFDELGDGAYAQGMPNLVYRLDDGPIHRVGIHIFDETSVDLEEVNRQVFQITKRTQATAEVVQGKAAAQLFQ